MTTEQQEKVDQFYEILNALAAYYNLSRVDMLEILDVLESKWKYK